MSDENVEKMFENIQRFRDTNSSILLSSIEPTHGIDRFLNRTLDFHLNYRGPEQLKELLSKYGYKNFQTFPEPMGVFNVIVGHTF
jgi:hypothetical protein